VRLAVALRRWIDMVAARQSARRVVLDVGMHAVAGLADLVPAMRKRSAHSRLVEDVEYGHAAGEPLRMDLLLPRAPGPHPVLMYFHGGAFAIGSKRTHRALAAAYASRGWLVCNVDYRLAPQHPFPAAIEDACAAWLWACREIARHDGDPQRMVVAGESAGANLALGVTLACCTMRPEPFAAAVHAQGVRPLAALLYYGFLQASQPQRYRRPGVSALAAKVASDAARSYLGAHATQPGPAQALADPLCIVEAMDASPGLPPIFIAAGQDDPCAPDSQRLAAALQRIGSPCSVHDYPGQSHGFHVMFWREEAKRCWLDSFAFLDQVLAQAAPGRSQAA
jgi:acetyl esterase